MPKYFARVRFSYPLPILFLVLRVLFCAVVTVGFLRAEAPEKMAGRTLAVPVPTDNYPHAFTGASEKSEGFAVELLDAVARVMDLKLRRAVGPSHDMRPGLLAGQYDILPTYSYEPAREAFVAFSASYLELDGALFVNRHDKTIRTVDDLAGRTVLVVGPASPGERYVRQHLPKARLVYANGGEDGLRRIVARQADALFLTRLTALSAIERYGLNDVVSLGAPMDGFGVRLCFAVRRSDTALLARLNEGLAILHRTGEYDRIYRKWFGRFEPRHFSVQQFGLTLAILLAAALFATLWALRRQRQLRRRIARQAEELQESRTILAEAQTFAQLGHWRRVLAPPGGVEWSDETLRIFERDPRAGPPTSLEEMMVSMPAEDAAAWREAIERSTRENHAYSLDLRISPHPERQKTIHVRGRSWCDASGHIVAVFGTVQDVTARRAAELALQESEQLLRAFYENLPSAVGVLEFTGGAWHFVSLNPEAVRLCGLTAMPLPGTEALTEKFALSGQVWWRDLLTRASAAPGPIKHEFRREDLRRDFTATIVPLKAQSGRPRCCFLIEDSTERKEKDAEIAQGRRLRAIGEMVGGIAHEFNNLLTPIALKCEALLAEWPHIPALHADHKLVADAARRAADLTRRLLAFGRKADPQPEMVDLRSAVDANLELLRHTVDRRIRLTNTVRGDLPALYINSADLNQILLNLLLNARDTLEDKLQRPHPETWVPTISVDATCLPADPNLPANSAGKPRVEKWFCLTVADNGLGMARAVLERIFEPFYSTKPVGRGTGLGLATVWHLVTSLGGRVNVDSTEGLGTTFFISIPMRTGPAVAAAATAAPGPAANGKGLRLLVAEDEDSISRVLMALLTRDQHRVTLASNGREAWNLLSAAPGNFDALLFDLNMPEVTGLEFARRARGLPYDGTMIVMSGRISEDHRSELNELGVHGIIEKPFTLSALREVLAPVVAAAAARKAP
jgi:two-component system, cell cycle sensor histidine kinase and response regulator CckA